jgi:hypothetical protein
MKCPPKVCVWRIETTFLSDFGFRMVGQPLRRYETPQRLHIGTFWISLSICISKRLRLSLEVGFRERYESIGKY